MPATLVVFSGLPGVGKTTIARVLADRLAAVYVRIDTIERGLMDGGMAKVDIKGLGYLAGCRLSTENLSLGRTVVADCVNSMELTRAWWRAAAKEACAGILEVWVECSDVDEHQRRVEERRGGLDQPNLPSWDEVLNRTFEPWPEETLRVDSAAATPESAVEKILESLSLTEPR